MTVDLSAYSIQVQENGVNSHNKRQRKFNKKFPYPVRAESSIIAMNKFLVALVIALCLGLSLTTVQCQDTGFYYYSEGNEIQFKRNELKQNSFQTLIHKDFFPFFSNNEPILESIENQSISKEKIYSKQNIESEYSNSNNPIPIAKFRPAFLDFQIKEIGIPSLQTVEIINLGRDPLRLESISGSTIHFYCSFFLDKVIPSGGNTSFDVYFLAREEGVAESAIYINTNKGIIKYNVQGIGINNRYNLKPILNVRILSNTSFTSQINLHNPHNTSMQIMEIYSSDDDLHIELNENYLKNNDSNKKVQSWYLRPFETKSIAALRYIARHATNHTAFLGIMATFPEYNHGKIKEKLNTISFILPIELEISNQLGIYSPLKLIDFGTISISSSTSKARDHYAKLLFNKATDNADSIYFSDRINNSVRVVDLYLTNSAEIPLRITEINSVRHNSALEINLLDNIELPADKEKLTKVAEIKFNPIKSKRASQNYGKIIVKTNDKNIWLQLSFAADLHVGGLDYKIEQTNFYVPYNSFGTEIRKQNLYQAVDFENKYAFPIVVYSITLNDHAMKYFKIIDFDKPVILNKIMPYKSLFKIKFDSIEFLKDHQATESNKNSGPYVPHDSINQKHFGIYMCTVHTNFTNFQVPLHIYDSQLTFKLLNEASINSDDLLLNPIAINSTKEIPIIISNHNPIDISFDMFGIDRVGDDKGDVFKSIKNKLDLNLMYFEPLTQNQEYARIYINETYKNQNIANNLKIPAFHRMVISFVIQNKYDASSDLLNSVKFEYELVISTKYQIKKKFKIEFSIINGDLQLVETSRNKNTDYEYTKSVKIESFPTKISIYPLYIKNQFVNNIQTDLIQIQNFGDSFAFNWFSNLKSGNPGLIRANGTHTLIGHIQFNPQFICIPLCYTGLEPRQRASIIDRSSLFIDRLHEINLNTEKSQIYDLWLKTFSLKQIPGVKNTKNEDVNTFEVDTFLFTFLKEHWSLLRKRNASFIASMELIMSQSDIKENKENFLYRFPIEINFKWPRLIQKVSTFEIPSMPIIFPLTQVHSGRHTRNITLHNPSNSTVLIQIMLANNYSHKQNLFEFIQSESSLFYDLKYQTIMDNLMRPNNNNNNKIEKTNRSYFRLNLSEEKKRSIMEKEFKQLNTIPDRTDSFIFALKPDEKTEVQIEFHPEKIGKYEDMLLIRNNLTILDAQLISGEVGTAELRINNLPPMKSSLFFNEIQQSSTILQSADFSNIILQMNKNDFEHCTSDNTQESFMDFDNDRILHSSHIDHYSHILDKISHDDNQLPNIQIKNDTKDGVEVIFMSHELSSSGHSNEKYKSSLKFKDGIVLRGYLILKNIGNTDLNVMNVVFDGDSCFSRGIEVTYCNPFSIAPFDHTAPLNESVFLLEIRYRPDFTMAVIKKSLVLETNIGDLRYSIEVQIPHYMLSICHDSLPRPPLEGYLFYLGILLVVLLVAVMFLTSMIESRSIVKYQYEVYRQMYSNNNKNCFNNNNNSDITDGQSEYQTAAVVKPATQNVTHRLARNNNKLLAEKNKSTTMSQVNLKKGKQNSESPNQNHSHRNMTKSSNNSRATNSHQNISSDSSVSSCTSSTKKQNSSPKAEKLKNNNNNQTNNINNTGDLKAIPIVPEIINVPENPTNQINKPFAFKTSQKLNKQNNRPSNPPEVTNLPAPAPKKLNKVITAASVQNENLANQRKNYLNQQKSQLKASKSSPNPCVEVPSKQNQANEAKKFHHQLHHLKNFNSNHLGDEANKIITKQQKTAVDVNMTNTKNQVNPHSPPIRGIKPTLNDFKCNDMLASSLFSNLPSINKLNTQNQLEKLEIELLNNQLQQLQQQNKQQLQEISYLNGPTLLTGGSKMSESSSSPSPNSTSSSSSSSVSNKLQQLSTEHLIQQNKSDLIDMITNSNRLEKNEKYEIQDNFSLYNTSVPSWYTDDQNLDESNSLSSSPLSDSWIMDDLTSTSMENDYDRIVQETEDFKQSFFELQNQHQQNSNSCSPSNLHTQLTESMVRSAELDKIFYSLINKSENHSNLANFQSNYKLHPNLKASFSADDQYSNQLGQNSNAFLGPIERPKNFQHSNSLFAETELKLNNQYALGSNLKMTGEYIAILNALFSAKNQEMINSDNTNNNPKPHHEVHTDLTVFNQNNNNNDNNKNNTPVKQPLLKAKSSDDTDRFKEFNLFENSLLRSYNDEPTASASYWPITGSINTSDRDSQESKSAPWNSVLLNDFDNYAAPASLNNSSTGNHIKSLWATSSNSKETNATNGKEKHIENLKNKKKN